jgi:hypothetical protein
MSGCMVVLYICMSHDLVCFVHCKSLGYLMHMDYGPNIGLNCPLHTIVRSSTRAVLLTFVLGTQLG